MYSQTPARLWSSQFWGICNSLKKEDYEGEEEEEEEEEEICATSKPPSSADVLSTYVLYISYCRIYGEAIIWITSLLVAEEITLSVQRKSIACYGGIDSELWLHW